MKLAEIECVNHRFKCWNINEHSVHMYLGMYQSDLVQFCIVAPRQWSKVFPTLDWGWLEKGSSTTKTMQLAALWPMILAYFYTSLIIRVYTEIMKNIE